MTYIYRKRNNWPVLTRTSLAGFHLPADSDAEQALTNLIRQLQKDDKHNHYADFLVTVRSDILDQFKRSESENIRLLIYAIAAFKRIYSEFSALDQVHAELRHRALVSTFAMVFASHASDVADRPSHEDLQLLSGNMAFLLLTVIADKKQPACRRMLKRYLDDDDKKGLWLESVISNVANGFVDTAELREELAGLAHKKTAAEEALDAFTGDVFYMEDDALIKTWATLKEFINKSPHEMSFHTLLQVAAQALWCTNERLLAESPNAIKALVVSAASHLRAYEPVYDNILRHNLSPEILDVAKSLSAINAKLKPVQDAHVAANWLRQIKPPDAADAIRELLQPALASQSVFEYCAPRAFVEIVFRLSNRDKDILALVIDKRFDFLSPGRETPAEIDRIREIVQSLRCRVAEAQKEPRLSGLIIEKRLIPALEKALGKLPAQPPATATHQATGTMPTPTP